MMQGEAIYVEPPPNYTFRWHYGSGAHMHRGHASVVWRNSLACSAAVVLQACSNVIRSLTLLVTVATSLYVKLSVLPQLSLRFHTDVNSRRKLVISDDCQVCQLKG